MRIGGRFHAVVRLVGLLALLAVPAAGAGGLEGRWRLVEQHYGKGQANLAPLDAPLHLEFTRRGSEIVGQVRAAGTKATGARQWPAIVTAGIPRSVRVQERRQGAAGDSIAVRYLVDPAPGDDLVLEIVEEYRIVEEGRALVGTVEVSFLRGGERRGSYTLHRRFERQP